MTEHGITESWETRERVLVALTGAPGGGDLVRRAARMARRTKGDLIGLHVGSSDGLTGQKPELLARHKKLLEELGGTCHETIGDNVASTLVAYATTHHATQIVLGTSRRSRWTELVGGSIINRVVREAKDIDVHVIATEPVAGSRSRRPRVPTVSAHLTSRRVGAFAAAAIAVVLLGAMLAENSALDRNTPGWATSSAGLLVFLGVVVVIAAIGGRVPALLTAGAAVILVDVYLVPPYGSFSMVRGTDALFIATFMLTAVLAIAAVDRAARRRVEVLESRDEADTVLALADRLARPNPPQVVVDEIGDTLDCDSVALLEPVGDGWTIVASAGVPVLTRPADGEHYELRDGHVLVMTGPVVPVQSQRIVVALLSYLEAILAIDRLQREANLSERLSEANDLRSALLAAVSHDLRTPLASIKALTSGWLEPDVDWSADDTREFIEHIDADADRLNRLVENLLDMSRLQAGALQPAKRPVGLDEIVPAALASLSRNDREVVVDVPESLPPVDVDPALLERVVANVVDNAIRHAAEGTVVRVEAARIADRVDVRIVDRGPGIPLAQREQVFQPFQRLGDTASDTGVGLGLAVAKGFVEAIDGEITVEDTPGGGITMVIGLPISVRTEPERELV